MSRIGLVIFGATGFAGKYAVEETVKIAKIKGGFTWGIAGRSKDKLQKLLEEVGKKYDTDLKDIPVLIADLSDQNSLNEMCSKASVIANCCGPYRFYGESVIKACINNKTHHVDISGEPEYMERMELEYHEKAKENGVYIVSACGFESIPADLGIVYLKNEFKGTVNSIESFFNAKVNGNPKSGTLHYGTWESAVHHLSNVNELEPLRKSLFPKKLPELKPKLKRRIFFHKNGSVNQWCYPFLGPDESVVERSQRYFSDKEKERPIQYSTYIAFNNLRSAFKILFLGLIFEILTKFSVGRKLLLNHPRFFSAGLISHEGPSEETLNNVEFTMTLFGKGWNEKLSESAKGHSSPPKEKFAVKISGTDPCYKGTGAALVLCGLTILNESDKMPDKGGVYPPGAAFAKTRLIEDLNLFAFQFEVISPSHSFGTFRYSETVGG